MLRILTAAPRKTLVPLPILPRAMECRPHGSLPPLVINFVSNVEGGTDAALGKVQVRDARAFVRFIRSAGNRTIHLNIDCAGGDGWGSFAIAMALLQHECTVSCRIVGCCSSGAAFIALAADKRTIAADGSVLLHKARRLYTPEQWEKADRLPPCAKDEINDSLNDLDDASAALLQARLDVSDEIARRWLEEKNRWSAAESLERGFVHAIDAADRKTRVERMRDGAVLFRDGVTYPPGQAVEYVGGLFVSQRAAGSTPSNDNRIDWFFAGSLEAA